MSQPPDATRALEALLFVSDEPVSSTVIPVQWVSAKSGPEVGQGGGPKSLFSKR